MTTIMDMKSPKNNQNSRIVPKTLKTVFGIFVLLVFIIKLCKIRVFANASREKSPFAKTALCILCVLYICRKKSYIFMHQLQKVLHFQKEEKSFFGLANMFIKLTFGVSCVKMTRKNAQKIAKKSIMLTVLTFSKNIVRPFFLDLSYQKQKSLFVKKYADLFLPSSVKLEKMPSFVTLDNKRDA